MGMRQKSYAILLFVAYDSCCRNHWKGNGDKHFHTPESYHTFAMSKGTNLLKTGIKINNNLKN